MIINAFLILVFLLAIFYSFKYRFVHLKCFTESIKEFKKNKSVYLTLLLTLASHIGAGNVVGVTTAIIYGGYGSLFWMVIFAFFSSVFSLIENTLSVKYQILIDGEYRSSSSNYINYGLKKKKLAYIFSVILLLSSTVLFGPLQVNTLKNSIQIPFKINNYIIFIIMLLFAFFVIFKGTRKILNLVEKIVPFMTICFLSICLIAIFVNIIYLPEAIGRILKDAFSFKSGVGGLIGSAITIGFKRSAFSNESGFGTTPSMTGMSEAKNPISQGLVQVLGVFIDTVFMCGLFGLMICIYDINLINKDGSLLAISVFEEILGGFGYYLGAFFLFIFSIATWVSSFYGGETNMIYLFSKKRIGLAKVIYRALYIIGTALGVFLTGLILWDFIDYGLILLGVINIYAIIKLEKRFKEELDIYIMKKM